MARPRVASGKEEEEEFWKEESTKKQITLPTCPTSLFSACLRETPKGSKAQTGLLLEQEKEKT